MTERQADGGFTTFLETMRDLATRVPEQSEHDRLTQDVEVLSEEDVKRRFVSLLEAVNPSVDCSCSDLSQVPDGEAKTCAYHTSRVGWIVHQARLLTPEQHNS